MNKGIAVKVKLFMLPQLTKPRDVRLGTPPACRRYARAAIPTANGIHIPETRSPTKRSKRGIVALSIESLFSVGLKKYLAVVDNVYDKNKSGRECPDYH
jgi:hypothetical protein